MPIVNTELQHLQVGGPSIQIDVDVFLPDGTLSAPDFPVLVIESNNQPTKGTCIVHPTNPRAVILSPGAVAGGGTVVINTDPACNIKLAIPFSTDPSEDLSEVRFKSAGPVQP